MEMWGVGVEDVMSSHGLTTPSLVAGRPAPPPQCLLNSGCLLVPVPSVPIPLRILLCPCHLSHLALMLLDTLLNL